MRQTQIKQFWTTHSKRILALAVGVGFLVLYWATLAPGVLPADSGEFQLVAAERGLAHPPGFPLYTMLAHIMTRLPIGPSPAYRVNFFSAMLIATTLMIVFRATWQITDSQLTALTVAVILGTSTTFWAQGTTANIRAMTVLFAALAFYTLIRYRDAEGENAKRRWLIGFALTVGFGVTHHLSLVFMALVWFVYLLLLDGTTHFDRWRRALPWGLLGLLPLLYLPFANSELRSIGAFINYALALGFQGDFFAFLTSGVLLERIAVIGNIMFFQFLTLIVISMLFGAVIVVIKDRLLAVLLIGSFVVHALITAIYRAPQTVEYLMPAYIPAVMVMGYGVARWWQGLRDQFYTVGGILMLALLMLAFVQVTVHGPSYNTLHEDVSAETYAAAIFEGAPENSIVLANWHWVTSLWYLQRIEGLRPDLQINYVAPGGEPYAETWASRIDEALATGDNVVATNYEPVAFANLPPSEPLGEAFLYRQTPRVTVPDGFIPVTLQLDDLVEVVGYQLDRNSAEIWSDVTLTLAWRPLADNVVGNLFAHLVAADGTLYAQDDLPTQTQPQGLTLTRFRLTPRPGALPGDYSILVGVAPATASTQPTRTPLTTLQVTAMSWTPYTANHTNIAIAGDQTVIGYDWDLTLPDQPRLYVHTKTADGFVTLVMDGWTQRIGTLFLNARKCPAPCNYVPFSAGIVWTGNSFSDDRFLQAGRKLTFYNYFKNTWPLTRDYVVSNSLIGLQEDGVSWAWVVQNDGVPALGAIPTLKWIARSAIRDVRSVAIPSTAAKGQEAIATLSMYDAFTNQSLTILDERIMGGSPWVTIGRFLIE